MGERVEKVILVGESSSGTREETEGRKEGEEIDVRLTSSLQDIVSNPRSHAPPPSRNILPPKTLSPSPFPNPSLPSARFILNLERKEDVGGTLATALGFPAGGGRERRQDEELRGDRGFC